MESSNSHTTTTAPPPALLEAPETDAQFWADQARASLSHNSPLSVDFRHSGWRRERLLVFEAFSRTKQSFARKEAYSYCGSHAYVLRNVDDPAEHRIAGSACHDRFCLPCANERSRAIAHNVIERVVGKQVRFLTLTVRSTGEPLHEVLDKLYTAFQALRRRGFWKRRVTGGVAFLEVTWSPTKRRWHPHFHILLQGKYLLHAQLKALWLEITGDSSILKIKLVHGTEHAARYVTKYASKPFNDTFLSIPQRLDEAIVALKGRKLCVTFGSWRGILLARRVADGTWENVGTLDTFICRAARGDLYCAGVLRELTDLDLSDLYARAPPRPSPPPTPRDPDVQLDWFGVWQRDGLWAYPLEP